MRVGDAAQADVFSALLRAEMADLAGLIAVAQARWMTRCDAGWGNPRTPEPVLRLREKMAEVQRLLDALRTRFAME